MITKVNIDVHCIRSNVVYRVFVDDDLVSERTFRWTPNQEYVTEQIIVDAPEGSEHTVRVESPFSPKAARIKRVEVNGTVTSTDRLWSTTFRC